jgi:hypothetical protein
MSSFKGYVLPVVFLGVGIFCTTITIYFSNEITYIASYYTCNEEEKECYEDLNRIERAIEAMKLLIHELHNATPNHVVFKKIKEVELDADFILERLDGVGGNEYLKNRRKKLVRQTLELTALMDKISAEYKGQGKCACDQECT